MDIVVFFKKIWGKQLFYPISDDAKFLTKLTGRPTLLKNQLKLCMQAGWKVTVQHEPIDWENSENKEDVNRELENDKS